MPPEVRAKLRHLKLVATDIDGTLTDGSIYLSKWGELLKQFNAQDGFGISLASANDLRIAFITGRDSPLVERRAGELGVEDVYLGCLDKVGALRELAAKYGLGMDQLGFVGDDLPDAATFQHVGVGIAVASATAETRQKADLVTERPGGGGALREAIERVFEARGTWESIVAGVVEGRAP